jgi:hypothetical protein
MYPGSGNYTDVNGHVWYAGTVVGGDASCSPVTQSCFGNYGGNSPAWPNLTDILLYEVPIATDYNDLRFDIIVPNGQYSILAKFANGSGSDLGNFVIETQGVALSTPTDVFTNVGGNYPWDYTTTATVTNNKLSFVLRAVNTTGAMVAPFISALSVSQTSSGPTLPTPPTNLKVIGVQ